MLHQGVGTYSPTKVRGPRRKVALMDRNGLIIVVSSGHVFFVFYVRRDSCPENIISQPLLELV